MTSTEIKNLPASVRGSSWGAGQDDSRHGLIVVAGEGLEVWLDPCQLAGGEPVATIQDLVVEQDHGVVGAVGLDVLGEGFDVVAVEAWEQIGEGMRR